MQGYVKSREPAVPGSIPAALGSFEAEVRFYLEIAPTVGVRVPGCYEAEIHPDGGTRIVLEDLSAWELGADPIEAARLLADLHRRWTGTACERWGWLHSTYTADDLVEALFDELWPSIRARADLTPRARSLGDRLVGNVAAAGLASARAGVPTLAHGDASSRNFRTSPDGELVLTDWEDVSADPGIGDIAWLLVSSVAPERWDEVIAAYGSASSGSASSGSASSGSASCGSADGFVESLPAVAVQGFLSMGDYAEDTPEAVAWNARLDAAAARL
jgi:Phosphotransferase enzyme family